MPPRVLLTSTNLASSWLGAAVRRLIRDCSSAAVVTTAEPKLKERAHHATLVHGALQGAGVARVGYFDLDREDASSLWRFDCVCFADGNPFYLLERLRASGGDAVVEELFGCGKPLLAYGTSGCLFGGTLRHLRSFDTSISDLGCPNATALNLLPFSLLPQANRWRARLGDYAARLERSGQICGEIVELDDDEALWREGEETYRLAAETVGGGSTAEAPTPGKVERSAITGPWSSPSVAI